MVLSEYLIIFRKDCERGGSLIEDKNFGRDLKWKKKKKKVFSIVIHLYYYYFFQKKKKKNGDILCVVYIIYKDRL